MFIRFLEQVSSLAVVFTLIGIRGIAGLPELLPDRFEFPPAFTELSEHQYEEIRDLAVPIAMSLKAQKAIGIGVGRSPTPIIRFIQNIPESKIAAINLPLMRFS